MSLDNIITTLEDWGDNFIPTLEDATEAAGAGYVASLLRRVQFKGENSNKKKLGTYAKSTARRKKKKGQQSQFINLTDTFEMLRSIDVRDIKTSEDSLSFRVSPDDKVRDDAKVTNKELMKIQEERFGPIMQPTEEELENIKDDYLDSFERLIRRG